MDKKVVLKAADDRAMYRVGDPGKVETGELHRPDHADFATTAELHQQRFNGQRINGATKDWELWVLGKKVSSVSQVVYLNNPESIPVAYADYFRMDVDLLEVKGC